MSEFQTSNRLAKTRTTVVTFSETDTLLGHCDSDLESDEDMSRSTHATPLLRTASDTSITENYDPSFSELVHQIETAIDDGIDPTLILQGSSGSYFCRNKDNEIVGVFKPKNEEPYGELNPKWGKWVQRNFCCCMYGRDCLLKNAGYLSEAGASIVDECLGLNIVPRTRVVKLTSTSFYYSRLERARSKAVDSASKRFETLGKHLRQGLPPKVGSLQTFVKGYKDAVIFLKETPYDTLPERIQKQLHFQFEKLVVLDYLTRNTDRKNDNWLIRYEEPHSDGTGGSIKIAAIDNGLSFPVKHPDNWRAYPYHWGWLPMAQIPFSQEIVDLVLPLLNSDDFVEDLGDQLYVLFSRDKSFSRKKFRQQLAVMRGQVMNLRKALSDRCSPEQLLQMRTARVFLSSNLEDPDDSSRYKQMFTKRLPFFQWC